MNPLAKILSQSKITHYATSAELRSRIGRPLLPCPDCQSPVLAVLQSGDLACPDCRPELWDIDQHRPAAAVALLLAVADNGLAVEIDKTTLEPIDGK